MRYSVSSRACLHVQNCASVQSAWHMHVVSLVGNFEIFHTVSICESISIQIVFLT